MGWCDSLTESKGRFSKATPWKSYWRKHLQMTSFSFSLVFWGGMFPWSPNHILCFLVFVRAVATIEDMRSLHSFLCISLRQIMNIFGLNWCNWDWCKFLGNRCVRWKTLNLERKPKNSVHCCVINASSGAGECRIVWFSFQWEKNWFRRIFDGLQIFFGRLCWAWGIWISAFLEAFYLFILVM